MNILVIRVSAIGDVIHTIPAIFLFKRHFPHAYIHWVVQQKAAHLLVDQPFLEHTWVLPDKYLQPAQWQQTARTIKELRQHRWDAVIDFQGLLKTAAFTLPLLGKKYGFSSVHARERASAWFTHHHDAPDYVNIVQKNLSLASTVAYHLGATVCSPCIDDLRTTFHLAVPPKKQEQVITWFTDNQIANYLLLCPNTTWPSKHWPEDHWTSFIDLVVKAQLPITPILVGTTFGVAAQAVAAQCQQRNLPVVICPAWDLLTMCHLIKHARLLIAPDTGLLHIADFLGTPAIGIFGPTNKEKHGPFWTKINKALCIQIPCPHVYQKTHGHDGNSTCMAALTPTQLLSQVLRSLEK
jgi:heptosyltransferase-1